MNPLLRLLQRFRRFDSQRLRRRQRDAGVHGERSGLFARLRGLLRRSQPSREGLGGGGDPLRFGYSYTVYWLKLARTWDLARRRAIAAALARTLDGSDFAPTATERRFRVEGLDGVYSGASLLALSKVLSALRAAEAAPAQRKAGKGQASQSRA